MKKSLRMSAVALSTGILMLGAGTALATVNQNYQTSQIMQNNISVQNSGAQVLNSINNIEIVSNGSGTSVFGIARDAVNGDRLYAWGSNANYNLGIGDKGGNIRIPTLVESISGKGSITHVSVSSNFTIVVLNGTQIWGAGMNDYGQFGSGPDYISNKVPEFVKSFDFARIGRIESIMISPSHTVAIVNNHLYTWGANSAGQLGTGDRNNRNTPTLVTKNLTGKLSNVQCGNAFTAIMTTNETGSHIYLWGVNNYSQQGNGSVNTDVLEPTLQAHPMTGTIVDFFVFPNSVFVVTNEQGVTHLYAWGWNTDSLLGLGNITAHIATPTEVNWAPDLPITKIVGSNVSALILAANGDVFTTGNFASNGFDSAAINTFTKLDLPPMTNAAGIYNGLFVTSVNGSYVWGNNSTGMYGDNTTVSSRKPAPIIAFSKPSALTATGKEIESLLTSGTSAIYADGIFNVDVFKEYIDVSSFPANTVFTMDTAPVVNTESETIELTVNANLSYAALDGAYSTTSAVFTITLSKTQTNWGLIIGLSVGGGVLLLIIIGLLIWWYTRRRGGGGMRSGYGSAFSEFGNNARMWFSDIYNGTISKLGGRHGHSRSRRSY